MVFVLVWSSGQRPVSRLRRNDIYRRNISHLTLDYPKVSTIGFFWECGGAHLIPTIPYHYDGRTAVSILSDIPSVFKTLFTKAHSGLIPQKDGFVQWKFWVTIQVVHLTFTHSPTNKWITVSRERLVFNFFLRVYKWDVKYRKRKGENWF